MPEVNAPEKIEARKPDKKANMKRAIMSLFLDAVDTYHKSIKGTDTHYFLELDSQTARLLKINSRQGKTLGVLTFSERLESSNNSSLISALLSLLDRSHHRGEPLYVQLSFPDQILNKIVPVELNENQTIEQWILNNRDKIFPPTGDEEINYDYCVMERSPTQRLLCLSIIRKEKLNQIVDVLEEMNLNVEDISSGGFHIHTLLSKKLKGSDLENSTVLRVKDSSVEVVIYEDGSPEFLTECPLRLTDIRQVLAALGDVRKNRPSLIVLSNEECVQGIRENIRLAGYQVISGHELNDSLSENIKQLPSEYWMLFSFYLNHRSLKKNYTNLIPPGRNREISLKAVHRAFVLSFKIAAVSLAVLLVLQLGLWTYLKANQNRLERFESKLTQLEALQKENESLSGKFNLASSISQAKTSKARLLYELGMLAPDSLWLREIGGMPAGANDENTGLELTGLTVSQEQVNRFLSNLESSQDFRSVKLEYLDHAGFQQSERIPTKYRNALYKFKITAERVT